MNTVDSLVLSTRNCLAAGASQDVESVREHAEAVMKAFTRDGAGPCLDVLTDVVTWMYARGALATATAMGRRVVTLARSADDPARLRKALTCYGGACSTSGQLGPALDAFIEALALAESLGVKRLVRIAWNNLGGAWAAAASYDKAAAAFERVVAYEDPDDERPNHVRAAAYANLAWARLHSERFVDGIAAIRCAVAVDPEPTTQPDLIARVFMENTYTRLLLGVGDLEQAREHCNAAGQYAARAQSPHADVAFLIAQGMCHVHSGRPADGIAALEHALAVARPMRPLLRDVLLALVNAHEVVRDEGRALRFQVHLENEVQHDIHAAGAEEEDPGDADTVMANQTRRLKLLADERERFAGRLDGLKRLARSASAIEDPDGAQTALVVNLCEQLAAEAHLDQRGVADIAIAAALRDIGKLAIPPEIIKKPVPLTQDELGVVRLHVTAGAEMLAHDAIADLTVAHSVARHHHERWDGTGYPEGLAHQEIPIAARIVAIADTYVAMTHPRPWRQAHAHDETASFIRAQAGRRFDPILVDAFERILARRDQIRNA